MGKICNEYILACVTMICHIYIIDLPKEVIIWLEFFGFSGHILVRILDILVINEKYKHCYCKDLEKTFFSVL